MIRTLDRTPNFLRRRFKIMGKGDPRTRKGKIFKGTFGKARPQRPRKKVVAKATEAAPAQ